MGSGEGSVTSAVVERLNQAAKEQLECGNYEKALEHYVSAVEESERIKNHDTEYACLLNAGACMVSLGRCKEGLQLLERAINIVDVSGKELDKDSATTHADVYFNAGVAAQELKDFEKAESYFKLSLELYLTFSLKQYASEACTNLAKCYRHLGNTEKEVDILQGSQKLHHDLGNSDAEALACGELVVAYLLGNKISECRQALCTAKMMCLRSINPKTQGQLYAQFGLVYTALGLYEEALASFERALPLVKSSCQSQQLEATILQNMGVVYNEKRQYSDGVVYHTTAATIHGHLENYQAQVKCLCNLAVAHAQLKEFNKAKETFISALEKATLINDYILQLQAHEGLGSVYYQMNKFPKAKESFHNALGVLQHIKYDTGLARERIMEKIADVVEAEQHQMASFQNALKDSQSKMTLQREHSMSDPTRPTSALGLSSSLQSPTNDISKSLSSGGIDSTGIQSVRPNLEGDNNPSGSRRTRHSSNTDEFNRHTPVQIPFYAERKQLVPLSATPQMVQPTPLPCVITVADGNNKSVQSHLELQQTIRSLQFGTTTDGSSHDGTFSTANTPMCAKRTPAPAKTPLSSRSTTATATVRNTSSRNIPPTPSSRLDVYNEDYEQQLLNDYMNTYADDNYKVFSTDSREQTDSDSGNDELGVSIFSRNAPRQRSSSRQRTSRPPRTPYRRKILTPRVPQVVQEGSLAISPIARQEYETKKNKKTDAQNILRISSSSSDQTRRSRPTASSSPANTSRSSQLSRVCVIL